MRVKAKERISTMIDLNALIDRVMTDKVEIEVRIMPDTEMEITMRPWKPFETRCPYDKTQKEEHDD